MTAPSRKKLGFLVAALFVLALCLMAGCTATSQGGSSSASAAQESASSASFEAAQSAQATSASASSAASASTSSAASAASSTSESGTSAASIAPYGKPFDEWPEECLDARGYPTLYAVLNLEGWELETMLVHLDCTFEGADKGWSNEDGLKFGVVGPNGTLNDAEIAELHKPGTQVASVYILSVPGYGSARDVLNASNVVVEDQYYLPDGSAIAVVHGLNRVRAFVVIYQSNGQYTCLVATQAAMTSGLFAELVDSTVVEGASISETWELLTGSRIGERS